MRLSYIEISQSDTKISRTLLLLDHLVKVFLGKVKGNHVVNARIDFTSALIPDSVCLLRSLLMWWQFQVMALWQIVACLLFIYTQRGMGIVFYPTHSPLKSGGPSQLIRISLMNLVITKFDPTREGILCEPNVSNDLLERLLFTANPYDIIMM